MNAWSPVRVAALVLASSFANAACSAQSPGEASGTTEQPVSGAFAWKGYTWTPTSGGMAGVAPGDPNNVSVDSSGYLHLKIVNGSGGWTASEVFTTSNLGFGTYQWQISGPIDRMDHTVVLGLFPYGPAAGIGSDGQNEIDEEFSFWNDELSNVNADWGVYPATSAGNHWEDDFSFSLNGGSATTTRMTWSSTGVAFTLLSGFQPITSNAGLIGTYNYAPSSASANVPQKAVPLGMNLWCYKGFPSSGKNVEVVIQDFQFVPLGQPPPPVDAGSSSGGSSGGGSGSSSGGGSGSGGAGANLAPSGTGALWSKNTSSAANTNRTPNGAVNDGNLTTSVVINAAGEGGGPLWEAAGVTWSSSQTVASAQFYNGTIDSYGNGFFESGFKLQWTTDGSTWLDSGWTASPAYPDSSAAGGQTYSFAGTAQPGVLGVRVTGQTGPSSWSAAVSELRVFAPAAAPPPPPPPSTKNLNPTKDAYVRGGAYAAANFGTAPDLIVKNGSNASYDRNSWLSFDTSGLSHVTSAKLRLYAKSLDTANANTVPVTVSFAPSSDAWGETTIAWNNAPAMGGGVGVAQVTSASAGTWIEYDVTSSVQATTDGVATFVLTAAPGSNRGVDFGSREDADPPVLVVTQ
jgi:hypothetical protein